MKKVSLSVAFLLAVVVIHAQTPSYVPSNGLVGWWPFDGNANDLSENNNDGVVNGAVLTTDRNGVENAAYLFDGDNDNIEVPNSPSLQVSSITISGWVKCNTAPIVGESGMMSIVSKWFHLLDCGAESDTYIATLSNYNFSIRMEAASSLYPGSTIISGSDINLDEWVFVTYVHDELSGGRVYLNAVSAGSNSVTGEICTSTNSLLFGADSDLGELWRFFSGALDDFGIWNRALSQDEITGLYLRCPSMSGYEIVGDVSPVAFQSSIYEFQLNEGSTYEWSVQNGVIVSGQGSNSIEVLWAGTGVGSVTVTETGEFGCSGDPVTFDVVVIPTGVDKVDSMPFSLFPIPAKENLTLNCNNELIGSEFFIYDAIGKKVFAGKVSQGISNLDISLLNSGAYRLGISREGRIYTLPFIVE